MTKKSPQPTTKKKQHPPRVKTHKEKQAAPTKKEKLKNSLVEMPETLLRNLRKLLHDQDKEFIPEEELLGVLKLRASMNRMIGILGHLTLIQEILSRAIQETKDSLMFPNKETPRILRVLLFSILGQISRVDRLLELEITEESDDDSPHNPPRSSPPVSPMNVEDKELSSFLREFKGDKNNT